MVAGAGGPGAAGGADATARSITILPQSDGN